MAVLLESTTVEGYQLWHFGNLDPSKLVFEGHNHDITYINNIENANVGKIPIMTIDGKLETSNYDPSRFSDIDHEHEQYTTASFFQISVPNQPNIYADKKDDILNIIPSTNIIITTDENTDSLIIASKHPNVNAALSSLNANRTYIQSLQIDEFGHIINVGTGTETVVDTNTTYILNSYNDPDGTKIKLIDSNNVVNAVELKPEGGINISAASHTIIGIKHADTSSQLSIVNPDDIEIYSLQLDEYGHLTNILSRIKPVAYVHPEYEIIEENVITNPDTFEYIKSLNIKTNNLGHVISFNTEIDELPYASTTKDGVLSKEFYSIFYNKVNSNINAITNAIPTWSENGTNLTDGLLVINTITESNPTRIPTELAVKTYVDNITQNLTVNFKYMGIYDPITSTNMYPSSKKNNYYIVSSNGKIGGNEPSNFDIYENDILLCIADTFGGDEFIAGANFIILSFDEDVDSLQLINTLNINTTEDVLFPIANAGDCYRIGNFGVIGSVSKQNGLSVNMDDYLLCLETTDEEETYDIAQNKWLLYKYPSQNIISNKSSTFGNFPVWANADGNLLIDSGYNVNNLAELIGGIGGGGGGGATYFKLDSDENIAVSDSLGINHFTTDENGDLVPSLRTSDDNPVDFTIKEKEKLDKLFYTFVEDSIPKNPELIFTNSYNINEWTDLYTNNTEMVKLIQNIYIINNNNNEVSVELRITDNLNNELHRIIPDTILSEFGIIDFKDTTEIPEFNIIMNTTNYYSININQKVQFKCSHLNVDFNINIENFNTDEYFSFLISNLTINTNEWITVFENKEPYVSFDEELLNIFNNISIYNPNNESININIRMLNEDDILVHNIIPPLTLNSNSGKFIKNCNIHIKENYKIQLNVSNTNIQLLLNGTIKTN